jgi:cytochrome P450
MQTTSVVASRHAEVSAVLADPAFVVPPVPPAGARAGIDWLRASVARFSTGPDHEPRRALVVDELDGLPPATARDRARARTSEVLRRAGDDPVDLMGTVARRVPVGVLAEALGLPAEVTGPVAEVARGYQPGTGSGPATDRAVAGLVELLGGSPDESTAARIGLLAQACDATAGLIGNAVLAMLRGRLRDPAEAIVAETMRFDPPVLGTRRVALGPASLGGTHLEANTVVRLDFAPANRDPAVFAEPDRFDPARPGRALTLGAGPHRCPGGEHAIAIAAGVLDATRDCRLAEPEVGYEPSANLRIPKRLVVYPR